MYLWIALNKTIFVSVFLFSLPKIIKLMVRGWKILTVSLKTCLSSKYFIHNGLHPQPHHANHTEGYQEHISKKSIVKTATIKSCMYYRGISIPHNKIGRNT